MTKLLSTYARSCGLQIDPKGPNIKQAFYPLPHERYITIQTGSANQAAKNYDHWVEVLSLIKPMLEANRIAIVHIGVNEDPALPGTHDLRGKTSFLQANYLISKTLLHVGGDSVFAHCAGWHHRPLVAIYGTTSVSAHGPYWYDPTKTRFIESHRWGGLPTYVAQEPIKTVNLIPPEQIANEVLALLNVQHTFTQQSRFWGLLYGQPIIDLVPDAVPNVGFMPGVPMSVRMDYLHNEEVLTQILATGRQVSIVTCKGINPEILNTYKAQILSYNHEVGSTGVEADDPHPSYMGTVRTLIPRHVFFARGKDEATLAALRFRYLDVATIEAVKDTTKEDYLGGALAYLNREDTKENRLALEAESSYSGLSTGAPGTLRFKTTKVFCRAGSVYLSVAHANASQAMVSLSDNVGTVIDNPSFFKDLNHMAFFYQPV